MKFINIIGRILGFISALLILISLFVTTIEIESLDISIYSMSLREYNTVGAGIILVLGIMSLAAVYFGKGFIVSILSIAILVMDFYTASTLNTGSPYMDTTIDKITFWFGDIFSPEAGFVLVIMGSVFLFFSGIIIRKSNEKMKNK
jgi:hypothetical protein